MNHKDTFRCFVSAYLGIQELEEYSLKEYILQDIEHALKKMIQLPVKEKIDYEKEIEQIKQDQNFKTNLQDCLIVLPRINAPMEVVFLVKEKLQKIKEENE